MKRTALERYFCGTEIFQIVPFLKGFRPFCFDAEHFSNVIYQLPSQDNSIFQNHRNLFLHTLQWSPFYIQSSIFKIRTFQNTHLKSENGFFEPIDLSQAADIHFDENTIDDSSDDFHSKVDNSLKETPDFCMSLKKEVTTPIRDYESSSQADDSAPSNLDNVMTPRNPKLTPPDPVRRNDYRVFLHDIKN